MSGNQTPSFARIDLERALTALRQREINYTEEEVDGPAWKFDHYRTSLPSERPGPPESSGVWARACLLIRDYEFSMPELVRAAYDPREPLLGRNMLLEARFSALRLYLGVRITSVIDETRPQAQRAWGWSYETLQGHLERGRISYEVVKHQNSGEIEFVINAYSQRAPTLGPLMRFGWTLFGRRRQLLFYRGCGQRMNEFTISAMQSPPAREHGSGLVLAPSDARVRSLERFTVCNLEPG